MKQYMDIDILNAKIAKHLASPYSFGNIHGCSEYCFENIAFCVGIHQDEIKDTDILAFYELYLQRFTAADGVMRSDFVKTMVLNGLLYMGKTLGRCDTVVLQAFRERLGRVYQFAMSGEQIFYTEEERKQFKAVPAVWRECGIVRYEHTNPYLRLPYVYDLLGYSVVYGMEQAMDEQIDAVIRYICSEQYQEAVKLGYGIGINGENGFLKSTYYAVGWDVRLYRHTPKQELLYMFLLSGIPYIRCTAWYQTNLSRYEATVESDDDAYFTALYKQARKTYWTSGCYMSFGRNRVEKKQGVIDLFKELRGEI